MKTAIIIGAGPAGLTAAYQFLTETDIRPILIEQEHFVGGIARTIEFEGNRMDLGGHRFFTKNKEIERLWKTLLPPQGAAAADDLALGRKVPLAPNGPDPEREDRVLLHRNRVSRILYLRKLFDYPISLTPQTVLNLGLWRTLRAGIGYLLAAAGKREEKTLEDFMINRFGAPLYRMFFRDYTRKVWGRFPKDIDADWGAQRIKGLSLRKILLDFFRRFWGRKNAAATETSLIDSFYYPKFGPGQLWETMRREIEQRGRQLILGAKAVRFSFDGDHIIAVTIKENDETRRIAGDYFLSVMPIPELTRAMAEHPGSTAALKLAASLPFRDFITVGLLVDKLKLKTPHGRLIPDCWIYVQEKDVKLGRIQIFNNWSPYMVQDPAHTVWLGLEYFCDKDDALWSMSDEDFVAFAVDELIRLNLIDENCVKKSIRVNVEKAYPAYFDGYRNFPQVRAYLDSVENLYCIGRNGQHRYNNMDHSMLSAIAAVRAIAAGTGKETVWNVNTEQEYHEARGAQKEASDS